MIISSAFYMNEYAPYFRGQAKIVMNPTQHSCQYPSILIQKSVPIQNQLNG